MIKLSHCDEISAKQRDFRDKKNKSDEFFDKMEADIEELERIRIGEAFGIPKEEMFKEVRQHGRKEIIDMYDLTATHCQKLVDGDDGEYVLADKGAHARGARVTSGEIAVFSGARPKKGNYIHKGIKVEFDIWKAPNGLWFGDHSATSGGNGGGSRAIMLDDAEFAFETQKECLEYCVKRAIHSLSHKNINEDPDEVEIPCPDCVAWAKEHIEVTQLDENDNQTGTEMWSPDKEYSQVKYKVIGCELDEDGDPIVGECPTCDHTRPDGPWFDENKITRDETPEETAARVELQKSTPKHGKLQGEAEKLIAKLGAMIGISCDKGQKKHHSAQLELAL